MTQSITCQQDIQEGRTSGGGKVAMPMCQAPRIADAFLRAGKVPANDNCPPAKEGMESLERDNAFKAAWQTFLIFFDVIVPLLLNQSIRFIMSWALGTRSKNQKSPEA